MFTIFLFALVAGSVHGQNPCPEYYDLAPSGTICFYFEKGETSSYLGAEQACIATGGHLATIVNAYDGDFLTRLVEGKSDMSGKPSNYWIGANLLMSPTWAWSSGQQMSYSNWAPNQPTDPSANSCGAVNADNNLWTKELCYSKKVYACSAVPNSGQGHMKFRGDRF